MPLKKTPCSRSSSWCARNGSLRALSRSVLCANSTPREPMLSSRQGKISMGSESPIDWPVEGRSAAASLSRRRGLGPHRRETTGRKDVEDAAADRELAGVLGDFDALVAHAREAGSRLVEVDSSPTPA